MTLGIQPCCLQYSTQDGFTSCVRRSFGRHPMNLASLIAWNFQCSPDFTFTASHSDLRTSNRNSPATGYLCLVERELTWVACSEDLIPFVLLGRAGLSFLVLFSIPAFCVILSLQGLFLLFNIYMLCLSLSHCPFPVKTYISIGNNNHSLNMFGIPPPKK